jgi:FtsH-binding integral membrane protein
MSNQYYDPNQNQGNYNQGNYNNNPNYNQYNQPAQAYPAPPQNYADAQYQNNDPFYDSNKEDNSLLGKSRLGFIRKVYLILAAQLAFTVGLSAISMTSESFLSFQINNPALFWVLLIVAFVVEIMIFCKPGFAKRVPQNYIALFLFTLGFGYMISFACAAVQQDYGDGTPVFVAAAMTLGITLALTLYAFTT